VGAVIGGRYRLLAKVGSGGMGTVYKVEHVRMGKVMAMKLLHGDLSRDQTMIRRFNREARAVSRLTSTNTVQVFDYGRSDGLVYIVMEYLHGRDLGELLAEVGPLPVARTAEIVRQVAVALAEAHSQGVIHRDIKPENIFICAPRNGVEVVKVLDFGLAKLVEGEELASRTLQGTVIGTPYYMSPEQIMAGEIGPASDIYSMGALVYKLLTGDPPFNSRTPMAILNQHLTETLPPLGERRPELAEELRRVEPVVQCAMAKEASARYPTVTALADDMIRRLTAIPEEDFRPGDSQLIIADKTWLKPVAPLDQPERISTRADFERYERALKWKRATSLALTVILLAGLVGVVYWGVVLDNFYRRAREQEPNDRPFDANLLYTGATITGTIGIPNLTGSRADVDFFEIRHAGSDGEMLGFEVSAVEGLDLVLDVYDLDGRLLARANRYGVGHAERIEGIMWTGQPVFAAARELWTEGMPARSAPDRPYHLSAVAIPWSPDLEREPNYEPTLAGPLDFGSPARGFLSHNDDHDLFVLPPVPPRGQILHIELEAPLDAPAQLDLLNGSGQLLRHLMTVPRGARGVTEVFVAARGRQPLHLDVRPLADAHFEGGESPYRLVVRPSPMAALTPQPPLP